MKPLYVGLLGSLLSLPLLVPPLHADDYWRGWCAGQWQAVQMLQEARDGWLQRVADQDAAAVDPTLPYDTRIPFALWGKVIDEILAQGPLYVPGARGTPLRPALVQPLPGLLIECPSGDVKEVPMPKVKG